MTSQRNTSVISCCCTIARRNKLNGCVNDVRAMHAMLSEHFGFDDFTILIDTDPNSEQPTGANIKVGSQWTV